ncbi:putative peptidase S1 [Halocaridina rubra]|uniref:CLIP domain-containing serine protease n=1 Tax=Halocaridina rubra TaxID=373956 RepID=A0AAN8ZXS1_HALRR
MVYKTSLWTGVLWTFLVVTARMAESQGRHSCARSDCISLQRCPQLAELLRAPTRDNIKKLQDATCFVSGQDPRVCCPPEPPKPKVSLLPRRCGEGLAGNRILGGEETPLGAYPWMAVFGYKEIGFDNIEYLCAGSVINDRYILTAAHCVEPQVLAVKRLEVIGLGDWDLKTTVDCQVTESGHRLCSPPSQNFTYEEIIVHPQYNTRTTYSDDIALIRLSRKVDLSGFWVHPVCLPPQNLNVRQVMHVPEAIVAGWGATENGTVSDRLLHVVLPVVDNQQCNTTYKGRTIAEQICIGGVAGQDSCKGDSGGPLVIRGPDGPPYLQIGIVSYGPTNCGLKSVPGVYTDISKYRDWIEENLRP